MDNKRLILFAALSVIVILLWDAWQAEYGTPPPAPVAQSSAPATGDVPSAAASSQASVTAGGDIPAAAAVVPGEESALKKGQRIRVVTDVFNLEIDTVGGDLREGDLTEYPVSVKEPGKPFRLLSDASNNIFVAQSGLLSSAAAAAPDHHAVYSAAQSEYRLADGADELRVPLTWTSDGGVSVTKTYVFRRGAYVIEVDHQVVNGAAAPWNGRLYRQFQRSRAERESALLYTYTGGVVSSEENKYQKLSFDDMDGSNLNKEIKGGWAAMIQHYFVAAWVPASQDQLNQFYSKALGGDRYVLGFVTPVTTIAPGASANLSSKLFVGPKLQHRLEVVAPALELTVDYGMLTFIAKPIFWVMEYIYGVVQNWGWSIILLTLLIKLVFYKLSETSYKSMANMRRLAPKLAQLKERYGDDRQRMSQGMMELYKKEKINPLGGCLPILVQIPVFISLYWVLLESVEMRQAPFILWINDLSIKDPFYVLPLIMGVTMFIQQKLNPPPPDPLQAKILMALPFVFTLFFAFFPAGLVLYWVANNVLSIAQQWYITARIEKAAAAKA